VLHSSSSPLGLRLIIRCGEYRHGMILGVLAEVARPP
jgi:hypothetical protein